MKIYLHSVDSRPSFPIAKRYTVININTGPFKDVI